LSGTVHMITKIPLRSSFARASRNAGLAYNTETKFTIQNKPGSIEDVIVGRQVICLGSFDDRSQLRVTHVDVRSR
jgi:hypothetical protein